MCASEDRVPHGGHSWLARMSPVTHFWISKHFETHLSIERLSWFLGFCIPLSHLEWAVPFLRADIAGSGKGKGVTAKTRAGPGKTEY